MAGVNFDGLFDRFSQQIYQSRKGRLRMQLIDALYKKYLPMTELAGLKVLDAAGGLGQMSHWFLSEGCTVDYFDVSSDMVDSVNNNFESAIAAGALTTQCLSITEFDQSGQFDFVNAHAVLEWLEQPYEALNRLCNAVKPEGYMGLMVYNRNMLMLRHLMRGTLQRAMSGNISGDRKGLTPISPLDPLEVISSLEQQGFTLLCQAGVRTFSDLAEKTVIDWYEEQELFEAELKLCQQRPYCDIGRYVLLIAQKSP